MRKKSGMGREGREHAVREEFETPPQGEQGRVERVGDGGGVTGNRKRPGVQSKNPFSF